MTAARPVRRWRRWLWRLLLAAVAVRLLLGLALPWLVELALPPLGFTARCGGASLSLSGGWLRLHDLELRFAERPEQPLWRCQEVALDVAMGELLAGRFAVVDAVVAGAELHLPQAADGRLDLPAAFAAGGPATPPPAAAAGAPWPASFALPLRIASARLHDLRVHFRAPGQAATARTAVVDLDLTDFGEPRRPGTLRLRAHGDGLLDHAALTVTAQFADAVAEVGIALAVRGLRHGELPLPAAWQAPFTAAATMDLQLDSTLRAVRRGAPGEAPQVEATLRGGWQLGGAPLLDLTASLGPGQPAGDQVTLPFRAELRAPDLLGTWSLTAGELRLAAERRELRAALAVTGCTLARFAPELAAAGLELPAGGLAVAAQFALASTTTAAGPTVDAALTGVSLGEGEDAVQLAALRLAGLRHGPDGLSIAALAVDGPVAAGTRAADGALELAGLRWRAPATAAPVATAPAAAPAVAAAPPGLPQLALGQLDWRGAVLRWRDEQLPGAPALELRDLRATGRALQCGRAGPPGTLQVEVRAVGAGALRAELEVTPRADGAALQATLAGEDLTLVAAAPWLDALGLESQLADGELRAAAALDLRTGADGLRLSAQVRDLQLRDGDLEWLGLDAAEMPDLRLGPGGLATGPVQVRGPRAFVRRRADGSLNWAGLATRPRPPANAANAPTAAAPAATAAPAAPLALGPLRCTGAQLRFRDERSATASQELTANAECGVFTGTAAVPFTADLQLAGAVDSLQLRGELRPAATALGLDLTLAARGVRGQGFAALVPPTVAVTLADGSLQAAARASLGPNQLAAELRDLRLGDGGAELFAIDSLRVDVPEWSAQRLHLAELRLAGVRGTAAATADGWRLPGVAWRRGAGAPAPVAPAPAAPAPTAADPAPAPAAPQPAAAAAPPLQLPDLQLDAIDLDLAGVAVQFDPAAPAQPLALRLQLVAPFATASDPQRSEPLRLRLTAAAPPLCGEATVDLQLFPFALQPHADASLVATGLDLPRLSAALPGLAGLATGTAADAAAQATAHLRLDLGRRDPRSWPLGRTLAMELLLEDVALREQRDGPVLAGVASVDADIRALDLAGGDLLLETLEIESPVLQVTRSAAGLDFAGLRLLPPPPPAAAATAPAPTPPAAASDPAAAPELAIDHLRLHGLRLDYRDTTTTPPTHLPLHDLDLEVERFSTRLWHEPRPFAFTTSLRGGEVELPKVQGGLGGLLAAAGVGAAGTELRPLVDEIALSGALQLHPLPKGRLRAEVSAFELAALQGLAARAGISLQQGLFDLATDIDLRAGAGIFVQSRQTFTGLSVSEPPGGPIASLLRLPAPLDTVLFVLRNEADEQRIPLQLHVPASGLRPGPVIDAVVEALAQVIGSAIARSPLRAAGAVTGLLGLGGRQDLTALAGAATFAAGRSELPAAELAAVATALADDAELEVVLHHELGAGDLPRVAELANPPTAVVAATVAALRSRRDVLLAQRQPLAAATAALYAGAQQPEAARQHRVLAALDTELAALERTLDRALDQLGEGTPQAAARRTRAAAQDLGEVRLLAVQAALQAAAPAAATRILRRPARGSPVAGLDDGGRVVWMVRRRVTGG